jgi:hypothetical protein
MNLALGDRRLDSSGTIAKSQESISRGGWGLPPPPQSNIDQQEAVVLREPQLSTEQSACSQLGAVTVQGRTHKLGWGRQNRVSAGEGPHCLWLTHAWLCSSLGQVINALCSCFSICKMGQQ